MSFRSPDRAPNGVEPSPGIDQILNPDRGLRSRPHRDWPRSMPFFFPHPRVRPFQRRRCSSNWSSLERWARKLLFTRWDLLFERVPSWASGNSRRRRWLTARFRTASPRNSRTSFPFSLEGWGWAGDDSWANDLWVRARSKPLDLSESITQAFLQSPQGLQSLLIHRFTSPLPCPSHPSPSIRSP